MSDSFRLSPQEQKVLENLVTAGIESSIQAMAKLYHETWAISSSSFRGGTPEDFYAMFTEGLQDEAGVFFSVQENVPFSFLIVFPQQSIQTLVGRLAKKHKDRLGTPLKVEELVLGEVGNILVNSFTGILGNKFSMPLFTSVPHFVRGPKKILLDATLASLQIPQGHILMAHVHMFSENLSADCDFLSIFNADFVRRLLARLEE